MDIKYPKPSAPRILQVILVLFKQKSDQKKSKHAKKSVMYPCPLFHLTAFCLWRRFNFGILSAAEIFKNQ